MNRMQELIELLNRAGKAYYQDAEEIMSDYQYDALYDELTGLEKELGVTLAGSPTVNSFAVHTPLTLVCQTVVLGGEAFQRRF